MDGNIHWELLERNKTITVDIYCQKFGSLAEAIRKKNARYATILQHDNARLHTANVTKVVIQALGLKVLQHSSYSSHLA